MKQNLRYVPLKLRQMPISGFSRDFRTIGIKRDQPRITRDNRIEFKKLYKSLIQFVAAHPCLLMIGRNVAVFRIRWTSSCIFIKILVSEDFSSEFQEIPRLVSASTN